MTKALEHIYNIAYKAGQMDMIVPALVYGILCGIGGCLIGMQL